MKYLIKLEHTYWLHQASFEVEADSDKEAWEKGEEICLGSDQWGHYRVTGAEAIMKPKEAVEILEANYTTITASWRDDPEKAKLADALALAIKALRMLTSLGGEYD